MFGFLSERITSTIQFSPSANAFINAITLSRGAWHKQANPLWGTCTNSHKKRNHNHTQLEADAVLVSVTVAELLAAQITAGVKTTEEGCLHKGKNRNTGIMGCKRPVTNTAEKIQSNRENHQLCQKTGDECAKMPWMKDGDFQLKSLTQTPQNGRATTKSQSFQIPQP